jgi:hypothetical protein
MERSRQQQAADRDGAAGDMSPLRRLAVALAVVWVLVATNPGEKSFRRYAADRRTAPPRPTFRVAVPAVTHALKRIFNAEPPAAADGRDVSFDGLDCALFTVVRARADDAPPQPAAAAVSSILPPPPSHVFLGIFGAWMPVPNPALWLDGAALRGALRALRDAVRALVRSGAAPSSLPGRPWEWLMASFAAAGAFWYVMPGAAARHLTLTWENARHAGRWWTLVLFHLSHGGSVLRLSRTVAACNYLAPLLLKHRIVTLSGLYGVVLTAAAMSTALGILVLARRNVFEARGAPPRTALEIDGGGGCVYALLVAACLDAQSGRPGAIKAWRVRPFELLMLNIAFDAMFLAGQKRIADYTAHTGAALGAWVYVAFNR